MSDVKQTIQVTNAGLSPILSIAQGTGMVDFEFTVSDFQIPAGSTAVAHNLQPTGNIVSQVCTLVGNVITVTPPAYYFLRGKNYMQIQVTGADSANLFTFLIEVWCSPNISAPVVSQNPDLISQLMSMIGNTQDLDTTAKNNLVAAINEIYARGVVDILDTMEEIDANTDSGKVAGALAVKELSSELNEVAEKTNWKYLGTYTGKQDINIPVSASHLLLQGYYTGGSKLVIQDELAWNDLDADATIYTTGNVNINAIYTVNKPDNKITLRDCQILASWTSPSWVNHANEYVQKIWYR